MERNDVELFSWAELFSKGVILGDLREKDISKSLVCKYFGKKSSKSTWKYISEHTTIEQQATILKLYQHLYETEDMPNKEITLQFERDLILMSRDEKVN